VAERGTLSFPPGSVYLEKLAVGPAGKGVCSLELSVEDNIRALAQAKDEKLERYAELAY
jgi:fructose-1,6-bisphosphatase II